MQFFVENTPIYGLGLLASYVAWASFDKLDRKGSYNYRDITKKLFIFLMKWNQFTFTI